MRARVPARVQQTSQRVGLLGQGGLIKMIV